MDVQDLTAGWTVGHDVFVGLTLTVPGRGLTHLSGANGSGKSTLVELVAGYMTPSVGAVQVAGLAASDPRARALRRVCRTRPALFSRMTARDHLTFAARCAGLPSTPAFARADAYGLGEWLGTEAGALSTGNARKLWLVMCTLGEPAVVVLDEPYNGLDRYGAELLDTEIQAWSSAGSVLLIAHALPAGLVPGHVVDLDRHRDPQWGQALHAMARNASAGAALSLAEADGTGG